MTDANATSRRTVEGILLSSPILFAVYCATAQLALLLAGVEREREEATTRSKIQNRGEVGKLKRFHRGIHITLRRSSSATRFFTTELELHYVGIQRLVDLQAQVFARAGRAARRR